MKVRVDAGVLVVAAAVLLFLAMRLLPAAMPESTTAVVWWSAGVALVGLGTSVLLHEMAHLLAARRYGVGGSVIAFESRGGRAELMGAAPHPRAEAYIALAGPAANAGLAVLGVALAEFAGLPAQGAGRVIVTFLTGVNAMLAVINLLPILPLDGGRVLRALLWSVLGSREEGARLAKRFSTVGVVLVAVGGVVAGMAGRLPWAIALLVGAFYLRWRGRSG